MRTLGRVLAILRTMRGFTQAEVARRSGVKRASISEYERGESVPDSSTLERLLLALGFRWTALDLGSWFCERLEADCGIVEIEESIYGTATLLPAASSLTARLHADLAVAHQTAAALSQVVAALEGESDVSSLLPSPPTVPLESRRSDERAAAKRQWARLKALSSKEQTKGLRAVPADVQWALCEILCAESQRLCGHDPQKAAFLADLALAAAGLAHCDEAFRVKLQAFSQAHIGNVMRAKGDLKAAETVLTMAEDLWMAGKDAESGLIEEGFVFLSKASLRRAQRRFSEAGEYLARAAHLAISQTFQIQVQISQAKLLEEVGDLERAFEILEQVKEFASPDEEPRILFVIWHNLADILSKLERFSEASGLLPEAWRYWRTVGGELNRLRLSWTEARIVIGLGSPEEGLTLLSRVRGEFASRAMAYDTALVSLELAVAYSAQGKDEQVKALARHMAPLFQVQEVHREALATLTLFRQAAERRGVTAAFAQDVLSYLRKARNQPGLRFEDWKKG